MGRSNKGGAFERALCKRFSLWWTKGKRDDVFWRSATSGARATQRAKKGLRTFGQYGDIQATDPIGQPLLDVCTIELKRGYSSQTIQDSFDKGSKAAMQGWEKWLHQAITDAAKAGTNGWLLVTRRDQRVPLVYMPADLYGALTVQADIEWPWPVLTYEAAIDVKGGGDIEVQVFATTLDNFFDVVPPKAFKKIAKRVKK